ncbi:EipB family protein [Roseococcus sp. DSY-14]|uniref:EipB family protein n=1 Tax=Roseococcus sp. DSY-14 TaxID=3369650 RepID=UPI00387ACD0C
MMRRTLLAAAAALCLATPAWATPEPGHEAMLAHRAAYRLALDSVRDGSGVTQAAGIMLFEVVDACDAWASRQRFTLVVGDRDGNAIETSSDYNTLEAKDGTTLRFSLTQLTEGAVTARVAGDAEVTAQGGRIRYSEPAAKEEPLPQGTLLPMVHTLRALAAARGGQRLLAAPLFDGTNAEGAQDTTTIFSGGWQPPQEGSRFAQLRDQGSARMRIAFFDRSPGGAGAGTPDYEVSLRYYANGVADELKMDFGDFTVNATLAELQPIPSPC